MKSSRIRLAVILGALSVVFIVIFQVYWVYNSFDVKEKQFDQRVSIALINVADRIAAFNNSQQPDLSPVMQMASNYFIVDVNESIDPVVLEHFLKSEFNARNIDIDFEYAIYDCETDLMVYGNYISKTEGKTREPSGIKFTKAKDLAYYFGVFFPTKPAYMMQSMNLWIISIILIITALGFFIYAIFIILRQKRLSEIQKDFINNMTHEFKTPISAIAISAEVLSDKNILDDPAKHKTYTNIIAEQNLKLEKHIEKVLQSASLEKQHQTLKIESLDICMILNDVEQATRNRLQKGQSLAIKCDKGLKNIHADVIHLSNMIFNLVDNAIKYGGPDVNIEVRCEEVGGSIMLRVIDDGPGIEARYQKKVFDRFFRVPGRSASSVKGFGLGLNYVKYVCKAHAWKIKLYSSAGNGCTFSISQM